jgi:periplasmic protein TonB
MMNKKNSASLMIALLVLGSTCIAQKEVGVVEENKTGKALTNDPGVFTIVEYMPEFPGGLSEMMRFVQKNVEFPKSALRDSTFTGCKTYIKMVIDTSGRAVDPTVIRGCQGCADCDAEAIRVVKAMPLWKPGMQNGRKVKVYYMLPINFTRR